MTRRPPHPSAARVQQAWEHLGCPELICGHMHQEYHHGHVEVLPMLGVTWR